jgi:hypothetical protein
MILALCGCGGGKSDATIDSPAPARGTLQSPPELVSTVTATALLLELSAVTGQQLLTLGGTPLCDIAVYTIRYITVGGANEATNASGAMMVPSGLNPSCRGTRSIVLYAHGTTTDRSFNISNLQDQQNAEGLMMAAFFAAQGYIVVAPNFAGFDSSTLPYHPYLVADQQSKDMIDALTAARSALPISAAPLTRDSGRLFITGYSQGGYVAMATHRAMQAAQMPVTASAPMSGPYAIAAFVDAIFFGRVNAGAPVFATLLLTGYQKSYGNIYTSAADVFEASYATGIDSLLPSSTPRSTLYAQGKLPNEALFNLLPPDASYAAITPATQPTGLAATFAHGFGAGNLIKNSFRLLYLQDAQANPDGGWPTITSGVVAAAPGLALRRALRQNDLRDWTPSVPVLLCGGNADPTVFWLNTQLMQGYWTAHAAASARFSILDLDSATTAPDPDASIKQQFAAARQLVAAGAILRGAGDGGASAVADAYHSTLVPPFCLTAVRSFFASQ